MRSLRCSPVTRRATLPDRAAEPRLAAGVLVSALVRRVAAEGGNAMILAKGDPTSGAILVVVAERGVTQAAFDRSLGRDGYELRATGPRDLAEPGALTDYLARRRKSDPDLWIVEVDGDGGMPERIARALLG